jgi:hypothetical protein
MVNDETEGNEVCDLRKVLSWHCLEALEIHENITQGSQLSSHDSNQAPVEISPTEF